MDDRGFGLELEETYGETATYDLDWFVEAEEANFSMGGTPVRKRGSSRMNKRARAGVLKPSGSTKHDADLQRIGHYFRGYLDNYVFTEAASGSINTHEFYGGEGKQLQSFRAIVMKDALKKYLKGMLINQMTLEASDDSLAVSADWIYKDETAEIIGVDNGASFTRPDELTDDLFIMFYDITVKLNSKNLLGTNGIVNSATFTGNNNLAQDDSVGFGSRSPQITAHAGDRDNNISISLSLTKDIIADILAMEYGATSARSMNACKILEVPLEFNISLCEYSGQSLKILFPKCTVNVEWEGSGTETPKVNLTLDSIGSSSVTLADGTTSVITDMYVLLLNKQGELVKE